MDQDLEVENGEYHQEEEVLTAIFFFFLPVTQIGARLPA